VLYFDTSFLAPLILEEETSAKIEQFISRLPVGELATSHLTRVEFSSLLAREVRTGGLDDEEAVKADRQFEASLEESFALLLPNLDDYELAKHYVQRHGLGLRTADGLHLAVATNHNAQAIYTLDKTFLKAGKVLGLPVSAGIRS
jgi:predicted nucleic acid-binding protein